MAVVLRTLLVGHTTIEQLLTSLSQTRGGGVGLDTVVFKKIHPLVHSIGYRLAERIDAYQIIFWENVGGGYLAVFEFALVAIGDFSNGKFLTPVELKDVVRVNAHKFRLALVKIVVANAEVIIYYRNGKYLMDFAKLVAAAHLFRYSLRNTIQHSLQIVRVACGLNLNDENLPFVVLCFNIDTIELIVRILLVALAFKYIDDSAFLTQKDFDKPLQDVKILLVSQKALYREVKPYKEIFFHNLAEYLVFDGKYKTKKEFGKKNPSRKFVLFF
jgi:hypothetical protein